MTQCPVGSIRRKETLEIIIEDWCIGCRKCAELCPYGNINMHSFEVMKEVPVTEKKQVKKDVAPAKPATGAPAAGSTAAKAASPPAAASTKPAAPVTAKALAVDPTGEKDKALPVQASGGASEKSAVPADVPVASASPPAGAAAGSAPAVPAPGAAQTALPSTAPKPATASPAGTPSALSKPATAPASPAKSAAPAAPKKMERKKVTVSKATTCDLCTQLSVPSCVYACPHDAAKRVDPVQFLARTIGRGSGFGERVKWLAERSNRTTH
jgi:Fe-S-cluster-containing hydrogenase component 2